MSEGGGLNAEGHVIDGPYDTSKLVCAGCGIDVWPRVGGYWFLLLQQRGRVQFPGATGLKLVLCSGCGRRVREAIESAGAGGPSYWPAGSDTESLVTGS